jgi:predicted acyl esterase
MSVEEIEFLSGGVTVRGDFYRPEGEGPYPTIVMAGGWCYVKELRQPQYAAEFVERGFAVLIFDYRNIGASDGEYRQHLDPWEQIADYKNAITYVSGRDDVDSERIGAWGISYSGGHVLILGAIDDRVKVVVSNVPVIDGYLNMWRVHGTERFRKLKDLVAEARTRFVDTGEHTYMGMSASPEGPDSPLTTWPLDEVKDTFVMLKETQAPRHEHRNTVASVENLMAYNAAPYAKRLIDTPTMMVVANDDDITLWDVELDVFNTIPCPAKEWVVLPGTDHMTLYSDLTALDYAAKAAGSWFSRHLATRSTLANDIARFS